MPPHYLSRRLTGPHGDGETLEGLQSIWQDEASAYVREESLERLQSLQRDEAQVVITPSETTPRGEDDTGAEGGVGEETRHRLELAVAFVLGHDDLYANFIRPSSAKRSPCFTGSSISEEDLDSLGQAGRGMTRPNCKDALGNSQLRAVPELIASFVTASSTEDADPRAHLHLQAAQINENEAPNVRHVEPHTRRARSLEEVLRSLEGLEMSNHLLADPVLEREDGMIHEQFENEAKFVEAQAAAIELHEYAQLSARRLEDVFRPPERTELTCVSLDEEVPDCAIVAQERAPIAPLSEDEDFTIIEPNLPREVVLGNLGFADGSAFAQQSLSDDVGSENEDAGGGWSTTEPDFVHFQDAGMDTASEISDPRRTASSPSVDASASESRSQAARLVDELFSRMEQDSDDIDALALLLEEDALATDANSVLESLTGEDWIMNALEPLSSLEAAALSQQAEGSHECGADASCYSYEQLRALTNLAPSMLAQHAVTIAQRSEEDLLVRRCVDLCTLSRLSPAELAPRGAALIARQLSHAHVLVRWAALVVLRQLDVDALAPHAAAVARCVGDTDLHVRQMALAVLNTLDLVAVVKHAGGTEDMQSPQGQLLKALDLVDASLAFPEGNSLLHCAANLRLVQVASFFAVRHRARLLDARNHQQHTPLHLAAKIGDLQISQILVRAGALTALRDEDRKTPEDLAREGQHHHVVALFCRCQTLSGTRVGVGDAFAVALNDKRPIKKVEWHAMRMDGVKGAAGIKHSLVAITVGHPEDVWHTYVMEKAATIAGSAELEHIKNGVFVSHWRDVSPAINEDPIHTLLAEEIKQSCPDLELSMRSLVDIAAELGPYNLATCNCHHMARSVYNACAREASQVAEMPNAMLSRLAELLLALGIDIGDNTAEERIIDQLKDLYDSSLKARSTWSNDKSMMSRLIEARVIVDHDTGQVSV